MDKMNSNLEVVRNKLENAVNNAIWIKYEDTLDDLKKRFIKSED